MINCKYMVCSQRCIVVTIDGALYNVDVDVVSSPVANLKCLGFQAPTQGREFYLELYGAFEVRKYADNEAIEQRVTSG